MAGATRTESLTPQGRLERLVSEAMVLVKKARKQRKSLKGDNFYANKLAQLRADAVNAFRDLSRHSVGDVAAMAEMVEGAFSPETAVKERMSTGRELVFSLKTDWPHGGTNKSLKEDAGLFPLNLLTQTGRGYLVTVGRQMNGCFSIGWHDACAVMMRRLLEATIIEAFEAQNLEAVIKDSNGDFLQLTPLVKAALTQSSWNLSKNTKKYLPKLRDLGHRSAHGRYFTAQKSDIEKVEGGFRIVVEEFLRLAGLL